jgi:hypothetical protein
LLVKTAQKPRLIPAVLGELEFVAQCRRPILAGPCEPAGVIADEIANLAGAARAAFLDSGKRSHAKGDQDVDLVRTLSLEPSERYSELIDPKYIEDGAIFDILAYTVIQQNVQAAVGFDPALTFVASKHV